MQHATTTLAPVRSLTTDLFVLTKVRLNSLVVATAAGGYYMAAPGDVSPVALGVACLGTALVAGGAAALNQVQERDLDRLMHRTRMRPMPDDRLTVREGTSIGAGLCATGLLVLWIGANGLAALIALATLLSYTLIYTPLKRRTSLNTVVGAVPGALPPLIGWAAARGTIEGPAPWTLFLVMFLWQLPHFLAIAWMCREDYARAGLPMLPVIDREGSLTGRQAVLWAATLVPFSQLPFVLGLANAAYGIGAIVLGAGLLGFAVVFAIRRTDLSARRLFLASIIYLPLLWTLMALGRQ
jgi:protoheme IX farnesyltransferase